MVRYRRWQDSYSYWWRWRNWIQLQDMVWRDRSRWAVWSTRCKPAWWSWRDSPRRGLDMVQWWTGYFSPGISVCRICPQGWACWIKCRYDPATKFSSHVQLSTSRSRQVDDHNNCSITVLLDDRFLAVYSKHNGVPSFTQELRRLPLLSLYPTGMKKNKASACLQCLSLNRWVWCDIQLPSQHEF